jgi:long-chain acyl-CoA synthetase
VRILVEPENLLMPLLTDRLKFGNIYFRDKTYTPDTVIQSIDAVAESLNKRVTSNSPFVYLFAPNHIKMVYALFGIIKSGRICVLVDPAIGKLELAEMITDTIPGALIRIDKTTDTFDFEKEFEFRDCGVEEKRLEGLEDVCLIMYTNASDGWAKGAMLTNESMLANAEAIISSNSIAKGTVSCSIIALNHLFGLQTGLIAPSLIQGDVLIIEPSDYATIRAIGNQIVTHKVTHIYAVPLVFYLLKKAPQMKEVAGNIRSLVSGGCKLSKKILEGYRTDWQLNIREGYGLTEASPICTWHRPEDVIKPDSIGRAFPCCEVAILDPQDQVLPVGKVGEICIKGQNVMKGYFNNPEATQVTLKNGWLHSGDSGRMDNDGYVYFIECKKRMFNVGGNKVYPAELERLLKIHSNVIRVAVLGESDRLLYNVIRVHVELRNKNEEAKKEYDDWCWNNISKYKLPQKIELM